MSYHGITLNKSRNDLLSQQAKELLEGYYLNPFEDYQEAFARPAIAFCNGDLELAQRIYDYASNLWFMYASPVLSNAPVPGHQPNAMPISCFLTYTPDTIDGQIATNAEIAALSVAGGGVGLHNGIRAVSEKAPGPIPYMKTVDAIIGYYRQSKTRKGSAAYYMDVSHPDIREHLHFRIPTGGDSARKADNRKGFHCAVNLTDEFVESVIENKDFNLVCPHTKEVRETVKARILWEEILETRTLTGEPYIQFNDVANRGLPKELKEKGLFIHGSNLCVAPETEILTDVGYLPIRELEDQDVNVWNGKEFTSTTVRKTGENQKIITVKFSNGQTLECTPYHKFYISTNYKGGNHVKRTCELKEGDKLIKFDLPIIEGDKILDKAYVNGFFTGDGCYASGKNRVYLYHEKRKLRGIIGEHENWHVQDEYNREYAHIDGLKDKFFVPDASYDIFSRLEWLAGWLDADGVVCNTSSNQAIQAASVEKEFLLDVHRMLQTLGVNSKITDMLDEGDRSLPLNDGSGEMGDFKCRKAWRLLISSSGLFKLSQLGFRTHRLKWVERKPQRNAERFVHVISVEDEGRKDDTYCFTESKRNMGVFNGVLTGNCNEVQLPTSEDRTAVCCLSSVNLEKYDEWKDTQMIEDLIVFLDNILDYFCEHAPKGMEKAVYSAKNERSVGLGAMGFHGYLMSKNIPWESGGFNSAVQYNNLIFKTIWEKANISTKRLAQIRGEAPDMKGSGKRNAHLVAIAPNANSSIICGCTASIEPINSNAYPHTTRAGTYLVKNKWLDKVFKEKTNDEELIDTWWKHVIDNNGSVMTLGCLDSHEKEVFKTAWEIDQHWVIQHAEDRQKYIDQGQSVNLFFPSGSEKGYINSVHMKAAKGNKIKGLYYLRTTNKQVADTVKSIQRTAIKDWNEDEICFSCQG